MPDLLAWGRRWLGVWRDALRAALLPAACAGAAVWTALQWASIVGADWPLRHRWLYHDVPRLLEDADWINGLAGLSAFLVFRCVLAPLPSLTCAMAVLVGLAAASERKMQVLDSPVLPWDLWFSLDLGAVASFAGVGQGAAVVAVVAGTGLGLGTLWRLRRMLLRQRGHIWGVLIAASVVGSWALAVVRPTTPLGLSGQMHVINWDLGANHANYGPYYSLLSNLRFIAIPPPSPSALKAADALDRLGEPWDRSEPATLAALPDVVTVLSESFTSLPVAIFGQPFTCLQNAPLSRLVSPAWGGMTANVEFEVFSGYPQAIFPAGSVPFLMYLRREVPYALPAQFRSAGYSTYAVHSFNRAFYARPTAYEMLGFEDYDGVEDLTVAPRRGQYVDDEVVFSAVLDKLAKPRERPAFVNAVTMMAHMPYDWPGRYPVPSSLAARLPGSLQAHKLSLTQYAAMIYDHEAMFCRFLERVRLLPKRTLVLFYGDHYPSFGNMDVYRDIHRALHGEALPFDLARLYAKPPLALFDSRKGFITLPTETAAYNAGALLLKQAGLPLRGPWAMEHKRRNAEIVAPQSLPGSVGERGRPAAADDPELAVLQAHAWRALLGGR